jgi:ADP-heptose:LPS heptosyltransferase
VAALFYTERVDVRHARHVVHKNLALASAIGAATDALTFSLEPVDSAAAAAVAAELPGGYALINPGAAWPNKRYPPDRLAEVARSIQRQHGLATIVLWGPGETATAQAVVDAARGAARLASPTTLGDLVALARGARLMVSGDTGPLHIAAAVGVPVVALFGPTDPERNGPWDAADASLSRYDACACHYQRRCHRGADGWCLADIAVEQVVAAVDERLARAART